MRINLENYEQYMIDYLESALSPETLVEFEKFLQLHDEIRQELELIKGVDSTVAIEPVVEPNLDFSYLKKSADARLNEEQLIAYMEGDLTIEEIELVDRTMVLYPENKALLNEFLQTKLSAENLVFDNKEKLKKPIAKRIPFYLNITSVAATLLMIGLLGYLIKQKPKSQSQAHIEPVLVQPELKNVTNIKPILPNKELPNLKSQPAKIEAINRESVLLVALESRPVNLMTKFNSELELPEIQLPIPQQSSYKLSIVKSEKPFLKPGDYVVQKFKDELLSQVGVSFHQETNEETQVRRYGLISKYFAYERIEKTN